jgi:hypothetical protein
VKVSSPILGMSSDLTKIETGAKSWLNCGKLHLTNGAVPLFSGALSSSSTESVFTYRPTRCAAWRPTPLAVRRPGIDMSGIVAGVSVFCGRRRGFDGGQFG